jgi:hypothetical protein
VLLVLLSAHAAPAHAARAFAWREEHRIGARFALEGGAYTYRADPDGRLERFYGGGLLLGDASVEYRPWEALAFEVFFRFKGHRYDGHDQSSNALVRTWGLPNASVGLGASFYFLRRETWEIGTSMGLGYDRYWAEEDATFSGFAMGARLLAAYYLHPNVGAGLQISAHYCDHQGGAYPSDPDRTRLPFELYELGAGVLVSFRFY